MRLRRTYELTAEELARFRKLNWSRPTEGAAWAFWRRVAGDRGLDASTILADDMLRDGYFTAMPLGHGQVWCHPLPLAMTGKPLTYAQDVAVMVADRDARIPIGSEYGAHFWKAAS